MTTISLNMREAMNAQNSGGVIPAALFTVNHDDLDGPLRLSTDPTERITTDPLVYGTVSRGDTYYFVPMEAVVPGEGPDSPQDSRLRFGNVGQARDQLLELLRSTSTPASVKIELVAADTPDTVERSWPALDLTGLGYAAETIDVSLTIDALDREEIPFLAFTPSVTPGLF